jgi:hypothetical protein
MRRSACEQQTSYIKKTPPPSGGDAEGATTTYQHLFVNAFGEATLAKL